MDKGKQKQAGGTDSYLGEERLMFQTLIQGKGHTQNGRISESLRLEVTSEDHPVQGLCSE